MSGKSGSDDSRSSLDLFVPPTDDSVIDGDGADAYLKRRQRKHQDYLKTARNAQKRIDMLRREEQRIEKLRKGNS